VSGPANREDSTPLAPTAYSIAPYARVQKSLKILRGSGESIMRCVQLVVEELEAPGRVIEEVERGHAIPLAVSENFGARFVAGYPKLERSCAWTGVNQEYTWPHPDQGKAAKLAPL
jgi:hypothetical protein